MSRATRFRSITRRADLAEAQRLSREDRHDEARALFARHGIDYLPILDGATPPVPVDR